MIGKCDLSAGLVITVSSLLLLGCGGKATSEEAAVASIDEQSVLTPAMTGVPVGVAAAGVEPEPEPELGAAIAAESDLMTTVPETPSTAAAEFCEGFVSNADAVEIPFLEKPNYLSAYTDPAFGSRVVRISDSVLGEVNKPAYSTVQAWNADESYLLLYRTGVGGSGHILLDGHTYEFIQHLDITPSDIEQVFWSHAEPDVLFYISKRSQDYGKLLQFNISTNSSTELADFSEHCGAGLPNSGNDVQMQALSDDLFGFNCQQDDEHHIMFSFEPSSGEVVTAPIGMGSNWTQWSAPVPAPSGNNFWHQGHVIDNSLERIIHQLDIASAIEHANIGMTHDGSDAYYQVGFDSSPNGCDGDLYQGVGHLVEHDMETGSCRNIISEQQGYPYPTSGTHMSAQAYLKPERVALSSIGKLNQLVHFTNRVPAPALLSEVYVVQTIPDNTKVCRLAHHRSYGKSAVNGSYDAYFGEPHATISPTGTRVVFGSDWYDSGSVDSYVIELPDYERP